MRILFMLSFIAINANARRVINYQTWTGSTDCNNFSPATNVPSTLNGASSPIAHLSTVGQPGYSSGNSAVVLDENVSNPIAVGTEYRISYPFKQGYSYEIIVNAKSIMNTGAVPNLRLKYTNSTSSSMTCTGAWTIDNLATGPSVFSQGVLSASFANYTYSLPVLPAAYSYLTVANIAGFNGGLQTFLIRRITIAETAWFTMSPSIVNITRGATTPVLLP